jgi:predicted ester cyclase
MWAGGAAIETEGVFAEDYVNHQEPSVEGGVTAIGLADWVELVKEHHRAFPDLRVEILTQIAEGDRVATHWRFSGTQIGAYEDREPTGRAVRWAGIQIDRFVGGRIAESWVSWDKYGLFAQLGLLH